jgi:hypothetical protein
VTRPPPHSSRRAVFPHRALQAYSLPQSRLGTPRGHSRRRTPDEVRALNPEVVPQVPNPGPRLAPPLTAAIAPVDQAPPRPGAELRQTGRVPVDARGVVVPAPLSVQLPEPVLQPGAPPLLAPLGPPLARVSPLLARRTAREVGLACPGSPPAPRHAQNVEAGVAGPLLPEARDHPRLARCPLQPERATPWAQLPVEPLRVGLLRNRAHDIIRVAHQARFAPTSWRDHVVNPQVQRIGQEHMGSEG